MNNRLPLEAMTVEEKLQAMEALWTDLCREGNVPSAPEWHGEILAQRETAVAEGTDEFESWEEARRRIEQELD
jgi:hypothetical protein